MESNFHDLNHLFRQLGLPSESGDIEAFVATHRLEPGMALPDAPFWSRVQAAFLAAAIADDADWSEAADELAARLS